VAEITFRTAAAADAITAMARRPDLLVGAGTVLNIENVKKAVDGGAKFIVTPGFNPKVVGYCLEHGIPITPGTVTATEIGLALDFGLNVVKFFPAEASGGIKTLKAVAAPVPAPAVKPAARPAVATHLAGGSPSPSKEATPRRPPPPVVPALKKMRGQIVKKKER